jgi:hypothetical protein
VLLGQVSGVGGNAVGDEASLDVITVGQTQVLLGRHVAQKGWTRKARDGDHISIRLFGNLVPSCVLHLHALQQDHLEKCDTLTGTKSTDVGGTDGRGDVVVACQPHKSPQTR